MGPTVSCLGPSLFRPPLENLMCPGPCASNTWWIKKGCLSCICLFKIKSIIFRSCKGQRWWYQKEKNKIMHTYVHAHTHMSFFLLAEVKKSLWMQSIKSCILWSNRTLLGVMNHHPSTRPLVWFFFPKMSQYRDGSHCSAIHEGCGPFSVVVH